MDIGHAEVVAEHLVVVAHTHAMGAQQTGSLGYAIVVGGDDAALAGGDVLGGVEGEAARAPATGSPAVLLGSVRLGCVLNDDEAMAVGYLLDTRHLGGVAVQVDGHDGSGARRDSGLYLVHIHIEAGRVDVNEDGRRAGV